MIDEQLLNKTSSYEKALIKVLEVRAERKEIYGDSWLKCDDWELLAHIKQKEQRIEFMILEKKDSSAAIDSLIDLCNYSLFLLELMLRKSDKNE